MEVPLRSGTFDVELSKALDDSANPFLLIHDCTTIFRILTYLNTLSGSFDCCLHV